MKFDHSVKYNGIFYKAGEDVPMGDNPKGASNPIPKAKVEDIKVEPKIEETKAVESANEKKLTKTDINRMSTKELRELANANGINGDDYVGSELKEMLIEKLV